MDANSDRQLIEDLIKSHTIIPYAYGQINFETIFDRQQDRYILMLVGWEHKYTRVHGCLIHVDLIDGKFWIQRDGTEIGIGNQLIEAGIPRSRIVLGFRSAMMREMLGLTVK